MIQIFKKDDAGYQNWRDSHPNGFICNIPYPKKRNEREYHLSHICLHKATCCTIGPDKNGEKPWTTNKYFKICADNFQLIDEWVMSHVEHPTGWQLKRCSICKP